MRRIRKQIYLDPWHQEKLAQVARKSRVSEAEIIRKALEEYLLSINQLPGDHPLSHLAGIGASKTDGFGASEHDTILYR